MGGINLNSTLEIIENRMSLRRYKDEDIKDKELNKIIESALRAPTAGNMMHYSIIVVKDEEKKSILSETCDSQPFIAEAPVVLIFLADFQRLYDYFKVCNLKEYCKENNIKYKSPNMAGLFLACGDAFIAAQNAVIAAESLGIGSCYIGDIIENYEIKKELFNLPDYTLPIAMLTLGYYPADLKRKKKSRFDKKYIVFKEEYRRLESSELKDMHKDREEKIRESNNYDAENFGQYIYARKFAAEFYDEMERSLQHMVIDWLESR